MRSNKHSNKLRGDEIGGAVSPAQSLYDISELEQASLEETDLYLERPPVAPKRHSIQFINHKRKLRQVAEVRLIHLSDELLKLADEIRYLNPLLAEVLDEAWDSTEAALEILENDEVL